MRSAAQRITLCLATAGLFSLIASPAWGHTHGYTTERRGDVESDFQTFRRIAKDTLSYVRGWTLNLNVDFGEVSSNGDFRLILASPEEVESAAPVCSSRWSCRVGDQVLINDERWQNATPTWPKSLNKYRHYVINHEVGHWLGLDHADCPGRGRAAPVMMQQSKGLQGCDARVWPKFWERSRVAARHDVEGWPTPPRDAPCTITGTGGDDELRGNNFVDVICAGGGNDFVHARKGFDIVRAGPGDDTVRLGSQEDFAHGSDGTDKIVGGRGADEFRGNRGPDELRGKSGRDLIGGGKGHDGAFGGGHGDTVRGGAGNDEIVGWAGSDEIWGMDGHDELRGKGGLDEIFGAKGGDTIGAGHHNDRAFGGQNADVIRGWGGDDELFGRAGPDRIDGGSGRDDCNGGAGRNVTTDCE